MADAINDLVPGQPMSDAQKEALAKSNMETSAEAHRQAAEHRARDLQNGGNDAPVTQVVADSILDKLKQLPQEGAPSTE